MDRAQRNWLRGLEERLRAAHAHDVAADLSARMRDYARAAAESELAEAERTAHAAALAEHPEWVRHTPEVRSRTRVRREVLVS